MNIFLTAALGIVESAGKGEFVKGLNQWAVKQPDVVKRVVQSVYPVIDVECENYAKTSKSKIDDKIVADLKEICEQVASDNNFELQNADAD